MTNNNEELLAALDKANKRLLANTLVMDAVSKTIKSTPELNDLWAKVNEAYEKSLALSNHLTAPLDEWEELYWDVANKEFLEMEDVRAVLLEIIKGKINE